MPNPRILDPAVDAGCREPCPSHGRSTRNAGLCCQARLLSLRFAYRNGRKAHQELGQLCLPGKYMAFECIPDQDLP
jgi:hypothetical protein